MDRIPSPYGFVPVCEQVWFPDWSDAPAHDWPFEDGVSGTLDVRVEAKTPVFVRPAPEPSPAAGGGSGNKGPPPKPFRLKEAGAHVVPATSFKGMVRNVLEIATFGKLSRVNDHRYGLRDLSGPEEIYRVFMARFGKARVGGHEKSVTLPLVSAGWLTRVDEGRDGEGDEIGSETVARIEPCGFAKVHYTDILQVARARGNRGYDPGKRQSGPSKYRGWVGATSGPAADGGPDPRDHAHRQVWFELEEHRAPEPLRPSRYGKARLASRERGRPGTLVFTGQPNVWGEREVQGRNKPKQHDFVFFDEGERRPAIPVTRRVFRDFEFIHSDRGQQARQVGEHVANEEWGFWKKAFQAGQRVPVFFLLHGREDGPPGDGMPLRAFGLAMMFRLAYQYTTEEAVRNAQPDQARRDLDFAETLLGTVGRSTKSSPERMVARKGRVRFSHLKLDGSPSYAPPVKDVVLGAPKASYYPIYVEHGPGFGEAPSEARNGRTRHMTFMDPGVRARGWKRYRHQEIWKPDPPQNVDFDRVGTQFEPLAAGSTFTGTLVLHNLRKVEVGALLWSLDFGGASDCYHGLGLAKPLGYGRVKVTVSPGRLEANDGSPVDLDACRKAFEDAADQWAQRAGLGPRWAATPQVRELLALARPLPKGDPSGRYPLLRNRDGKNEFVLAKQGGLALAPAAWPQKRAAFAPLGKPFDRVSKSFESGPDPRAEVRQAAAVGAGPGAGARTPTAGGYRPLGAASPPAAGRVGSISAPPPPKPFTGFQTGARIQVRLVSLSKKGKWRADLVDGSGEGIVQQGEPPAGAAEGQVVEVLFLSGGNPRDLSFRWG